MAAPWRRLTRRQLVWSVLLALGWLVAGLDVSRACAEPAGDDSLESRFTELEARFGAMEQKYSAITEENRSLRGELEDLRQRTAALPAGESAVGDDAPWFVDPKGFSAGYDNGFFLAADDPEEVPFTIKFNNQTMFRYTGFARHVREWTDNAGVVRDVTNRSNFEIPRGRLIFSGTALLPDLSYYINIDYNTVTTQPIGFRGYWLSYRFSELLELHVGQNKVPGSREWLTSSIHALGPDRSLATTFFRPSLSQGVWITGTPVEGLHYHAMLSNGFNTINTQPDELDNRFCWSGSLWWEPWGKFGSTFSDLEWHDEAVIRCGASLTYSAEHGQQGDPNAPENAEIRLSDGTVITETGALAPGVTLQAYEIGLAAIDFGWKRQGFSLAAEFYLQELFGLQGNGGLPINSTFAFGGFVQAASFLIPQEFEIYGRTSQVSGAFGTGGEYAGGFNWYILPAKSNLRFTFDAAWINRSPADQNRTDYRAGDTGFLLRTQVQMAF